MQGLDNDKEGPAILTSEVAWSPHADLRDALKVTTLFSQLWVCIRCSCNHHDIPLVLSAVTLPLRKVIDEITSVKAFAQGTSEKACGCVQGSLIWGL